MRSFARFAWCVLGYHLAVIAWGALVRATGSGAGCGQHWPTCNGQVVPRAANVETLIEYAHRATSGIALALVLALAVWARRVFPRGHAARAAASLSLLFIVTEALLGAGLVLFGWVASDASAGRGWAMALHLVNTFLLLAALALAAGLSGPPKPSETARRGGLPALVVAGLLAAVLAGVTGAIAALGDTLFRATTLAASMRQDLQPGASLLLRLRVLHPFAAGLAGLLLVAGARRAVQVCPQENVRRAAAAVTGLVAVELCAGAVNVLLLAPVWLQLAHLVLADLVWVSSVLVVAWTVAPRESREVEVPAAAAPG
jgi:cytochrome c oxidase assembly protein subunit 15